MSRATDNLLTLSFLCVSENSLLRENEGYNEKCNEAVPREKEDFIGCCPFPSVLNVDSYHLWLSSCIIHIPHIWIRKSGLAPIYVEHLANKSTMWMIQRITAALANARIDMYACTPIPGISHFVTADVFGQQRLIILMLPSVLPGQAFVIHTYITSTSSETVSDQSPKWHLQISP